MRSRSLHPTVLAATLLALPAAALAQGELGSAGAPPALVWETSLSVTSQLEGADDVAVDAEGNVLVLGYLPVEQDPYVLKLGGGGSLLWSRTFGGSALDAASALALDPAGDVYLAGVTASSDFPTLHAYQAALDGPSDAFLVKLSGADGSTLYSTYFGGSRSEWGYDVALGPDGSVHLAGRTDSADLDLAAPIQDGLTLTQCFCYDAFVARFTPTVDALTFGTYLGGTYDDAAAELEVDALGAITLAGTTESEDFPILSAAQPTMGGGDTDAFVARIGADLALEFSTFLGGEDRELVQGLQLDRRRAIYLAGSTRSIGFPTTPGAFQQQFVGGILSCEVPFGQDRNCYDMFVTKLGPAGSVSYSTYVGGHMEDEARNLAVDDAGRAHVTGYTYSSDFPMQAPFASVVLLRLGPQGRRLHYVLSHDTPGSNAGSAVALDGADVFLASSVGLPYDTYVAKLRVPRGSVVR